MEDIACGSMDGTISVFDVARAKLFHRLEGHTMPVRSLTYSPIGARVLFSASDDAHVHMYDAKGKSQVATISGHASWVLSVDASPDGAAIATGSSDRTESMGSYHEGYCADNEQPFRSSLGSGILTS